MTCFTALTLYMTVNENGMDFNALNIQGSFQYIDANAGLSVRSEEIKVSFPCINEDDFIFQAEAVMEYRNDALSVSGAFARVKARCDGSMHVDVTVESLEVGRAPAQVKRAQLTKTKRKAKKMF